MDSWRTRENGSLKVRFYGRLGEQLGAEVDVDPPADTATVATLRNILADMFPEASIDLQQRARACIADSIVGEDQGLAGTEVVEFFPPLSGG
jgi:molybdopterin converting factor small subunit